jgi:hypothetical protein
MGKGTDFHEETMKQVLSSEEIAARRTATEDLGEDVRGLHDGRIVKTEETGEQTQVAHAPVVGNWD